MHLILFLLLLLRFPKRATWSPAAFFCGLLICFGFLFSNWGPRACDSGCNFRFILSFSFHWHCPHSLVGATSFYLQIGCLTSCLCQAMQCSCKLELKVEGWLSGTSFLGLGGASGKGRHVVVGLGVAGLNLLGTALFLFSAAFSYLMLGLVSGSGGLNWLMGAGPIFPSTSKKVFIFLMIVGWGQSLVLQGVHLISCVVQSLLNICVPCMDMIFTSTSTTSTGSLHLKKLCKKLHSGCSKHAIFFLKYETYFSLHCFCLCLQIIPCYSLSYHHVKI